MAYHICRSGIGTFIRKHGRLGYISSFKRRSEEH